MQGKIRDCAIQQMSLRSHDLTSTINDVIYIKAKSDTVQIFATKTIFLVSRKAVRDSQPSEHCFEVPTYINHTYQLPLQRCSSFCWNAPASSRVFPCFAKNKAGNINFVTDSWLAFIWIK